ncbi:hypothetical protein BDV23DRAFT_107939 [Aspergillus alliaceus]|uniref:Uncharacterized protein n=1 Tax=Petromyces alliaceus TaxID=209559 RepID=A0A5N7C3S8_PETAA|nr:hypothetical protein BDV23DRAFT_107939 [Aspergillus alliaceus]
MTHNVAVKEGRKNFWQPGKKQRNIPFVEMDNSMSPRRQKLPFVQSQLTVSVRRNGTELRVKSSETATTRTTAEMLRDDQGERIDPTNKLNIQRRAGKELEKHSEVFSKQLTQQGNCHNYERERAMNRRKVKGVDTEEYALFFFVQTSQTRTFFCFFLFFALEFQCLSAFERENVPGVPREDARLKSKKGCKAFPLFWGFLKKALSVFPESLATKAENADKLAKLCDLYSGGVWRGRGRGEGGEKTTVWRSGAVPRPG